jgi:hypothetical protein
VHPRYALILSVTILKHGASDRVFPDQPSITERPPSPAPNLPNPYLTNFSPWPWDVNQWPESESGASGDPGPRLSSLPHPQVNPNAKLGSYFSPHMSAIFMYGNATPPPPPTAPRPGSYWHPHSEDAGAGEVIEEPERDYDEIEGTRSSYGDTNSDVAVEHRCSIRTEESARDDNDTVPEPAPAPVPIIIRPPPEFRLQTRLRDKHSWQQERHGPVALPSNPACARSPRFSVQRRL